MHASRELPPNSRPFDVLGIGELEESVYIALLEHPGATAGDIAGRRDLPARQIQQALQALESKGLATHLPERPVRYLPISPDIAIDALIARRNEELNRARACIDHLSDIAALGRARNRGEQQVEVIISADAGRRILEDMNDMARSEMICLKRPPTMITPLDEPADVETNAGNRGVRYRTVVDQTFLAQSGAIEHLRDGIRFGEEVRYVPTLPLKLMAVDHSIAFVPLDLDSPASSAHLVVRESALLDALWNLFERIWLEASPMYWDAAGNIRTAETGDAPDPVAAELLTLLSAGLNDKTIADELDMSPRTLNRRIGELMKALDARTRFQAGWLAARRLGALEGQV